MKLNQFVTKLAINVAALGLISITAQQANAGQLYNGWNYGIDSFTDGSGGESYNIRGMAIKETSDSIYVALTGGTPLNGVSNTSAADGNIGWGDLFFNFSGKDFKTASDNKQLFGIRFAGTNDSKVSTTGVFKNVNATSVALDNNGYANLPGYYNHYDSANTQGTDLSTKASALSYFGTGSILNVINTGTKIGEVTSLNMSALTSAGLNFGNFSASGSQTFGFKFDRSLLPTGSFTSNIFLECANDGVSLISKLDEVKSVPEPSGLLGLALVGGLVLGSSKIRKNRNGILES